MTQEVPIEQRQQFRLGQIQRYLDNQEKQIAKLRELLPADRSDESVSADPRSGTPDCITLAQNVQAAQAAVDTQSIIISDAIAIGTILGGYLMDAQMIHDANCT